MLVQGQRGCSLVWRMFMVLALLAIMLIGGCSKTEETASTLPPIAIEQGDECHVCGMMITNFPGPKGEAYLRSRSVPFKFCSTRDLFGFLLQPENRVNVTQIYVHDMGQTGWEHPANEALVDARKAWYVVDQPLQGAMGPTLASFSQLAEAQAFAGQHGGRLLQFDEITLEVLADAQGGNTMKTLH